MEGASGHNDLSNTRCGASTPWHGQTIPLARPRRGVENVT